MGKRWSKRWTSSGKGHRRNDVHALRVTPSASATPLQWALPPSKSHLIRALLLSAQSSKPVELYNVRHAGEDARAMRRCLQQLGISIDDYDLDGQRLTQVNPVHFEHHPDAMKWVVHGGGPSGFKRPATVLNAGNSGTTLRLLGTHAAMIGGPVMLDGDGSLRKRSSSELWETLEQGGAEVSVGMGEERLPALIDGPMDAERLAHGIKLDISRSSQPMSSWILAAPGLPCEVNLQLEGEAVSSRHAQLSLRLLQMFGGQALKESGKLSLKPSPVDKVERYSVPGDASMAAFSLLACTALGRPVDLIGWPKAEDAIGHEILHEKAKALGIKWDNSTLSKIETEGPVELDLRDANDLLPPLAAVLAFNQGGVLKGAAHAAYKESNRLNRTAEILHQFGMKAEVTNDGLLIEGGQTPSTPIRPVETHNDHRLFMTAVLLASKCGGDIVGQTLHLVADEPFIDRLKAAGIGIELVTLPPLED
jgi:3-phosphoshikimate 1-carboxyvinyltransferase